MRTRIFFLLLAACWLGGAGAAELPPHRPLRVLVVSDEVDPHMLPPEVRTQPGEIANALLQAGSGLNLDSAPGGVLEIATNDIEQATAVLATYDVLIYFAHRIPNNGNDPQGRQDAFTAAVDTFLQNGGGVVSFHHGAYTGAGKFDILELIGATATNVVPWNTVDGQNVINTAPGHFVTCHAVEYPGMVAYADAARGVAAATYPMFNNTPDERYPFFEYNASAAGNVQTLFGSDYAENGTTHLLGWIHQRPGWQGVVVGYQPGEYQPNAVDDLDGNNFQILANAILFAAGALPDDQIVLEAGRGPGAGEVTLDWAACDGNFAVFASADPATVDEPANELGQTTGNSWTDSPAAAVVYYLVIRP